jgi:hypothetical protein
MANSSGKFVLGFLGGAEVHRENSFALLEDFIGVYRKNNKGAEVTIMITVDEPFTDTMADLADYCLTHDYKLGLVGHSEAFEQPTVRALMRHASGNIYRLRDDQPSYSGLVNVIGVWGPDARLILLADPNEDDYAYHAILAANGKNIPVRSLLTGLDLVTFKDEEEETSEMARQEDDYEEDYEDEDEEDVEDLDDEDLEEEDDENPADDDDESEENDVVEDVIDESDEEDEEPEEPEDDDEEDSEEEEEEEDSEEEDDTEDADLEEDEDDVDSEDEEEEDEDDEESPDDEEEEEEPVVKASTKKAGSPRLTEISLTKMANRDRDEFYELAAEHGVYPGRGIKIPTMISRILDPSGTGPAPKKRAAPPAKKATKSTTKKRRPATRVVEPERRRARGTKKTVARAPASKKTAPARRGRPVKRAADSTQSAKAAKLIELAQAALELAEDLL